ncbi:hypothetical protein [Rhodococcus sp. IEGM 1379]|uniref:hypothetical protein n=1 Tax=Rhodococcus sp. IEGM 1379 TaxID=3047086 RepID=UPI0024B648D7|nr:hypothetical protein [Rhodococcus sp. IEGM 1379]MDI9916186.1 hypothetical protein [Rhodococcus sp. IEGM 1379]
MHADMRTLRITLSALTAFVVIVVVLAPFVSSQRTSMSSGERFWSIGTIGTGVLAVVAVGTAAGLVRSRTRTAAMVALAGILLELPGLHNQAFEAFAPVAAGVALGAVTSTLPKSLLATSVAGVLVAVYVSTAILDPNALPRRYSDYLAQDASQFQPPFTVVTLAALGLTALSILVFWNHNTDNRHDPDADATQRREQMAVRPVVITAVLTLTGLIVNWWFEVTTVWAAVPVLMGALAVTVIAALALGNGSHILLMSTATAASLAVVVANRPPEAVTLAQELTAARALSLGALIVAAAVLAAFRPSVVVSYGLLFVLTVAGFANYSARTTPLSEFLVVIAGAAAAYAIISAKMSEPPRTGGSRLLVGLGVIFGPTAFALLVYPRFSYGWTDYTPLEGEAAVSRFEPSSDLVILGCTALVIVTVCAYTSHRLRNVSRSGPSTPVVGTP